MRKNITSLKETTVEVLSRVYHLWLKCKRILSLFLKHRGKGVFISKCNRSLKQDVANNWYMNYCPR